MDCINQTMIDRNIYPCQRRQHLQQVDLNTVVRNSDSAAKLNIATG